MTDVHVPVLIAGGSLVGLTTAALLGSHGVNSLVVERHGGTAIHPRAASFHQRTMEIFRGLDMFDRVDDASHAEFVQDGAIMACEALAGKEIAYFQKSYNEGVEHLSPTPRRFITQIGLEPVIQQRARELGAEIRFNTELMAFNESPDGVTATIRSRADGAETTVHADYLVAADGAHSPVRKQLGIGLAGRGTFAHCITIYFTSDVREMIGDRNLSVIYVNRPEFLAFFRFSITADSGFLAVFSTRTEDGGKDTDVSADTSDERMKYFVCTALGAADDHPVQIQSVQSWDASAGWAESFHSGRVLLAGDSAHTMPPTGGFGGNTGIADAHNLAWKLAHVLGGTAGSGLLETYDVERRPASALVAEQAYSRYVARLDPDLPKENLQDILDDAAIELGAVYESTAVLANGAELPATHNPRTGVLLVGSRIPHVWLVRGGQKISTLDLVSGEFLLLAGRDGGAWREAGEKASAALGITVNVVVVGQDVTDIDDAFDAAYGIGAEGAVLVRPDDIAAWRSAASVPDPASAVTDALGAILARV